MPEWLTTGALVGTAVAAVWFDLREHRIPNALTVAALVLALVLRGLMGLSELGAGLLGGLLCLLFSLPFFMAGGLGGGDVKLMTAFGAMLGPYRLIPAFIAMALVGGVLAFVSMARRRVVRRTLRNLVFMLRTMGRRTGHEPMGRKTGRFMRLGSPGAVSVPYGVAISIGALYAWLL